MRRITLAELQEPAIDADFVAGVEEAQDRVDRFITEKVIENAEIEGDVTLELCQLGAGSTMPLQSWVFSQGDNAHDLCQAIVDAAREDGGACGNGKTKYQVTIKGQRGRCAFSLEFQPKHDDEVNEAPNEKGLVAQAMRHTEKVMNMFVQTVDKTLKRETDQFKEQNAELQRMRLSQTENIQMFAALYDAKHTRDLESKRLEKSEGRKDEIAGFLMQGIPHLVNKFAGGGKEILAAPSTPLEQMLHGFLSTFKNEDVQAMVETGTIALKKEQLFGLLEIFKAVQEKHAAYEASHASASASTNGAASVETSTPAPSPNA